MNVVGLDLSLTSTGVALANGETVRIQCRKVGAARLCAIVDTLTILFDGRDRVDLVAIEGYSYGSTSKAHTIGELGGVVRSWLHRDEVPYVVFAPQSRAKFATGKGNAGKDEVFAAAIRQLCYAGNSNDEADALWLRQIALYNFGGGMVAHTKYRDDVIAKYAPDFAALGQL